MKKLILICSGIALCFSLSGACVTHAEDEASSDIEWKQELSSDRQEIKEERLEMRENAQEAKSDEKQLHQQINDAIAAGDIQTANQLKSQLKDLHKENVQEKHQDVIDIKEARQELKSDVKEAREEGHIVPKKDKDNNPPGPRGGPGTNWENRPGPADGPGASPNRKIR